jgi:hypothetical protein
LSKSAAESDMSDKIESLDKVQISNVKLQYFQRPPGFLNSFTSLHF